MTEQTAAAVPEVTGAQIDGALVRYIDQTEFFKLRPEVRENVLKAVGMVLALDGQGRAVIASDRGHATEYAEKVTLDSDNAPSWRLVSDSFTAALTMLDPMVNFGDVAIGHIVTIARSEEREERRRLVELVLGGAGQYVSLAGDGQDTCFARWSAEAGSLPAAGSVEYWKALESREAAVFRMADIRSGLTGALEVLVERPWEKTGVPGGR